MPNHVKAAIPATRDPFVNTRLKHAGFTAGGEERFWMSTWNSNAGCLAALVTESGSERIFRFDPGRSEHGFYGSAYGGNDKMWLSGYLDTLVRLDLNTGEKEYFPTGMHRELVFNGFIYDDKTGMILCATYSLKEYGLIGYIFDAVNKQFVKRFQFPYSQKGNQFRNFYKNGDGTYTMVTTMPNMGFLNWDPATCEITELPGTMPIESGVSGLVVDDRVYISDKGWYDPKDDTFTDASTAAGKAVWCFVSGNKAYGVEGAASGLGIIYEWDMDTGETVHVTDIPDARAEHFCLSKNNKLICLNYFGFFYCIDPKIKAVTHSKKLDTDAVGHVDCLLKLDENKVLMTPFITQRFYELNLVTGVGEDMGRATDGWGEVLQTVWFEGKVYMASYTKGQLVEYDPKQRAYFPENPRIVVQPPEGAMRPVTICTGGKSLLYACNVEYGGLGSVFVKYTPSSGTGKFAEKPLGNLAVRSLFYDVGSGFVISGSAINADCNSCPATETGAVLARFDFDSLKADKTAQLPVSAETVIINGDLGNGKYLFMTTADGEHEWGVIDINSMEIEMITDVARRFLHAKQDAQTDKDSRVVIHYAGSPGKFLVATDLGIELWDAVNRFKIKDICDEYGYYKLVVCDKDIYLVYKKELSVYKDVL